MMVTEEHSVNGPARQDRLFEYLNRIATLATANLLWVFCSLPLVTLPVATAGLFNVLAPWVQGIPPDPFGDFFAGMRRHWLKSTVLGSLNLALAILVVVNALILRRMSLDLHWLPGQIAALLSLSAIILVTAVTLMANLYAWPLLVLSDPPLRQLVTTSLKLVFRHPVRSIILLSLAAAPFALSLLLPRAFLLFVAFAASALTVTWGADKVLRLVSSEE